MNRLGQKNIVVIITLALLLAILAVCAFVIWPKINEIREISTQVKQQKLDMETRYQKGQNLKKAHEDLNLIKDNQQPLLDSLVKKGEELKFITTLEETAAGKNVKQEINLSAPEESGDQNIRALNLKLSLQGSFIDVLRTINDMERLNYYIIINQLNFTGSDYAPTDSAENQYTGTKIVRANLAGVVYWSAL